MRRFLTGLAVLGFVALAITLGVLVAGSVRAPAEGGGTVTCGSLLRHAEPDPTAEREFGCGDLFIERRKDAITVAVIGGALVTAIAVAALAQVGAARAMARRADEVATP